MRNLFLMIFVITALAISINPVVIAADESFPITPSPIGPGNDAPSVHLASRFLDIGIDVDGSGNSINPVNIRNSFYAFTGEKILYYVLVRDDNGAQDIQTVRWVKNSSTGPQAQMGPCDDITANVGDSNGNAYFCRDGNDDQCGSNETVDIDNATNLHWDDQTDRIYKCELTVESNWGGADPGIYVEAFDMGGASGKTLQEMWTFNPPLTVTLGLSSGSTLAFGNKILDQSVQGSTAPNCILDFENDLTVRTCSLYDPTATPGKLCDISFSVNKIVLTNNGIVDLWPFIAASDFYALTGIAKCPFTNELDANQFEYRATQGTWTSGWRVMPQYAPNLGCGLPFTDNECRGGCRITDGSSINILGPTAHLDVELKLVWPTPCIGTFNNGTIYFIIRAV